MESLGEKLKQRREEKLISIDQVARDTHIAKRYLVALENEDFDEFPGETYLLGFLRNYSEYLDFNSEEIVNLYKNFRIQEQPVPIEELIEKRSPVNWPLIIIIVLLVGAIGSGGYFLVPEIIKAIKERPVEVADEVPEKADFVLEGKIVERQFSLGTSIEVPLENGEAPIIIISDIGTGVVFTSGGNQYELALEEERLIDINNDDDPDLKLYVRSISENGSECVLRLDRYLQGPSLATMEDVQNNEDTEINVEDIGETMDPEREQASRVIYSAPAEEPFIVDFVFRGNCNFHYSIDDGDRIERYFFKDEVTKLDVSRELNLWISNAGNTILRIRGIEIDLGTPGQITSNKITWVRNDAGGWSLVLIPMY